MAKSAKVFVFISLVYGAAMFLIISSFRAGDSVQEDKNLNPPSKFLTISETQENSQVVKEDNITRDQTDTESIEPVADELENEPEIETTEAVETDKNETPSVPEETTEQTESIPSETIEKTESEPTETVEEVKPVPKETVEETSSVPDEAIENAKTPSNDDDFFNAIAENIEAIHNETVAETKSVPNETVEESKVEDKTESKSEAAPSETVKEKEAETTPKETVEEPKTEKTETKTKATSKKTAKKPKAKTQTATKKTSEDKESARKETVEETKTETKATPKKAAKEVKEVKESKTKTEDKTESKSEVTPSETVQETETKTTPKETVEKTESVPKETVEESKTKPKAKISHKKTSKKPKSKTQAATKKTSEDTESVSKKTVEETKSVPKEIVEEPKTEKTETKTKASKKTVKEPKTSKKAKAPSKKTVEKTKSARNETVEEPKTAPSKVVEKVVPAKTVKSDTTKKTVEETKPATTETVGNNTTSEGTTEKSATVPEEIVQKNATVSNEIILAGNMTMRRKSRKYKSFKFTFDPFKLLGAYPDPTPYIPSVNYSQPHFGLINNDKYCEQVDHFNLRHPENMFDVMNFYTDFPNRSLMKRKVMKKLGNLFNTNVTRKMGVRKQMNRMYQYDKKITTFHITGDSYYQYHELGKHFACATQMFSHIPNHTLILQKDHFPLGFKNYKQKYEDRPQCYEKSILYPTTLRLFDKDECDEFFEILHSRKYKNSLPADPIQYILKIGHDAHKAEGVFLVDEYTKDILNKGYDHGDRCGKDETYLIVQRYITNPMLLDMNNKFHLRVYVFIASTNPLIVFYHDGYLRASIFPFEKGSNNKAAHFTNLLMGDKFANAVDDGVPSFANNGMSAKELEDHYLWSFEELSEYLYKSGKTNDSDWINNYMRPTLQKAFVHIVRMSSAPFWKQSNVYEMFGCDFILDDQMNLWFIEANANPLLDVQREMMTQMLTDLFEINYAYYRSRMKRILKVLEKIPQDGRVRKKDLRVKLAKWRSLYKRAAKNRLEPQYKISETNSWKKIVDENLKGVDAYFGHISEECL